MKYCIFQMEPYDGESTRGLFMPYSSLPDGIPDPNHYALVYEGEANGRAEHSTVLESLFCIFNVNHPQDFTGRSMSVSDVVRLTDDNGQHYCYYVDFFGFKPVPFEWEGK